MKINGDRIVQIILLALIASGVAIMGLNGSGNENSTRQGPPGGAPGAEDSTALTIAVEAQKAGRQTVSQFIRINGDVVAEKTVDIFSDTTGEIISINVNVGDYVQKGEILAVVDPSLPGKKYSASNVTSTISGTITAQNYQVGDTISTANAILTVGDLKDLQIETYIPERYVSVVSLDLEAVISFEALGGESFPGTVTEISPVIDTTSRTMEITLTLNEPDSRIKAGMFSSIRLVTKMSENTLAVPTNAVTSYYDDSVIFVVDAENHVERKIVQLGLTSDEIVEITDGINEGDLIVTQGQSSLSNGSTVRIVSAEE